MLNQTENSQTTTTTRRTREKKGETVANINGASDGGNRGPTHYFRSTPLSDEHGTRSALAQLTEYGLAPIDPQPPKPQSKLKT